MEHSTKNSKQTSLSRLYRQLSASSEVFSHQNEERFLSFISTRSSLEQSEPRLNEIAESTIQSDLLRFSHALEPHSKTLAQDFASLPWEVQPANPLLLSIQQRKGWGSRTRQFLAKQRAAVGAGLAAVLLLAIVPIWQHRERESNGATHSPVTNAQTVGSDHIFSWSSEHMIADQSVNPNPASDEIFRSDFKGG